MALQTVPTTKISYAANQDCIISNTTSKLVCRCDTATILSGTDLTLLSAALNEMQSYMVCLTDELCELLKHKLVLQCLHDPTCRKWVVVSQLQHYLSQSGKVSTLVELVGSRPKRRAWWTLYS